MTDIRIQNGEILWENGDCALTEGTECLIQNVMSRLGTDRGALFYAPDYGAGLLRFLHAPLDERTRIEIEAQLVQALKSEAGILRNSEKAAVSEAEGCFTASLTFKTADKGEEIRLNVRISEGLPREIIGEWDDL